MPFGKKNDNKLNLPEVLDFSNDTWSYKGDAPTYQIQSDGFTYDVVDADGNDKNAISLGIVGMIIIVLNAKSTKIKEQEVLPHFGNVIKTRNWHTMTVKEGNFLAQTAIKKLASSETSGDVFDLASYAPLEVKRALLKELFTISRLELPRECREEADHRIIDDIVPDIFANPDYELASLTGLIVKGDAQPDSKPSLSEATETVVPADITPFPTNVSAAASEPAKQPEAEPDSAFAELQKIYGRPADTVRPVPTPEPAVETPRNEPAPAAPAAPAYQEQRVSQPLPVQNTAPQQTAPNFGNLQPNDPFTGQGGYQQAAPNFSVPEPNDPFTGQGGYQQGAPNFSVPQPNDPFSQSGYRAAAMPYNFMGQQPVNPFAGAEPQEIPQPPAGNFGMPPQGNPYAPMNPMQSAPGQGYSGGAYNPNMQQYPQQMQGGAQMPNPNMPYPNQGWQQYPQQGQNPQSAPYPQNPSMYPPNGMPNNPQQGQYFWPQNPGQPNQGQNNQGQNNPGYPNQNA